MTTYQIIALVLNAAGLIAIVFAIYFLKQSAKDNQEENIKIVVSVDTEPALSKLKELKEELNKIKCS